MSGTQWAVAPRPCEVIEATSASWDAFLAAQAFPRRGHVPNGGTLSPGCAARRRAGGVLPRSGLLDMGAKLTLCDRRALARAGAADRGASPVSRRHLAAAVIRQTARAGVGPQADAGRAPGNRAMRPCEFFPGRRASRARPCMPSRTDTALAPAEALYSCVGRDVEAVVRGQHLQVREPRLRGLRACSRRAHEQA